MLRRRRPAVHADAGSRLRLPALGGDRLRLHSQRQRRQHLRYAGKQAERVAVDSRDDEAAGQEDVGHGGAFRRAAKGDPVELRLLGPVDGRADYSPTCQA
jgi:hypothetical protein